MSHNVSPPPPDDLPLREKLGMPPAHGQQLVPSAAPLPPRRTTSPEPPPLPSGHIPADLAARIAALEEWRLNLESQIAGQLASARDLIYALYHSPGEWVQTWPAPVARAYGRAQAEFDVGRRR